MSNDLNNWTCDQVHDALPDLAGGELSADASAALERHIRSCDCCAREVRSWKRATALVADAAAEEPLHRESNFPVARSSFARPLALAAALAVAFGLGAYVGNSSRTQPISPGATDSLTTRVREAAGHSPQTSPLGLALLGLARRQ